MIEVDFRPKRIQRRRTPGWRMPKGAVYVGRPTVYGNPFSVDRARAELAGVLLPSDDRLVAFLLVNVYRTWLTREVAEHLTIDLALLRGYDLACWCGLCDEHRDGLPLGVACPRCAICHADVVLELANA